MKSAPAGTPPASRQALSRRQRPSHGLTLIEVVIAMLLLGLMLGGTLQTFIMVRRSAEASIRHDNATNTAQSYIEQLRIALWNYSSDPANFPFSPAAGTPTAGVDKYALKTVKLKLSGGTESTPLYVSAGTPPDPATLAPGEMPAGATDNKVVVTVTQADGSIATKVPMTMHLWVWLENRSVPAEATYGQTRGLTLIYSWEYHDLGNLKKQTGSLRTMLSSVKTL